MFANQYDENWKNSSVMKEFAAIYQTLDPPTDAQQLPEGERAVPDAAMLADDGEADCDTTALEKSPSEVLAALAQIDEIVISLNKIASAEAMAGNVVAAYEIERAIEEVKNAGFSLWRNDD